jgi:hypothetical protein
MIGALAQGHMERRTLPFAEGSGSSLESGHGSMCLRCLGRSIHPNRPALGRTEEHPLKLTTDHDIVLLGLVAKFQGLDQSKRRNRKDLENRAGRAAKRIEE